MASLLAGVRFVAKEELDKQREAAKEAKRAREAAAAEAKTDAAAEAKRRLASGESQWVAPALLERVVKKHKKEKRETDDRQKKHKHKDKHKHKRDRHSADGRKSSGGDASDSDSGSGSGHDAVAPAPAPVPSGAEPPAACTAASRDDAGLSWMMKAPEGGGARPFAAAALSDRAKVAAEAAAEAAVSEAARAKARMSRELNPYAREGRDVNEWCKERVAADGDAEASRALVLSSSQSPDRRGVGGTDGGVSWEHKRLVRTVEEAEASGRSLKEVCAERFGSLDRLPELERVAKTPADQRLRSGGGSRSHLRAIAERQRNERGSGGMMRPKLDQGLSWRAGGGGRDDGGGRGVRLDAVAAEERRRGGGGAQFDWRRPREADNASRRGGEADGAGTNAFRDDGNFLTDFLEKQQRDAERDDRDDRDDRRGSRDRRSEPDQRADRKAEATAKAEAEAAKKARADAQAAQADERATARRTFLYRGEATAPAPASADVSGCGGRAVDSAGADSDSSPRDGAAEDAGTSVAAAGSCKLLAAAQRWSRTQSKHGGAGSRGGGALDALPPMAGAVGPDNEGSSQESAGMASHASAAAPVDANKLAARAMRAKMMGNTAEYERLQAAADAARASAPPPVSVPIVAAEGAGRGRDGSLVIELLVPDSAVGVIIGKGGVTISTMQTESGAQIKMTTERDEASGERVLLLRGATEAVDRAQALVEEKLNEAAEREAKGGGARGGAKHKAAKRRPAKAPAQTEAVPEFDPKTGQLVIVNKKVEVDEMAELAAAPDAPSTRRPKAVQRYEGGQRTKFFRDDDADVELKALVEAERRGGAKTMDDHFADNVARAKKFKGISADDEYDYDEGVEMHDKRSSRKSEAARLKAEKSSAAAAEKRQSISEVAAEKRFNAVRHLVVAIGNHVYMRVQDHSPIGLGHVLIEPLQHVASHTDAPEDVATEARNFQKCLIQMFESRGASFIFTEQYVATQGGRRSFAIECIPLPERDALVAPAYFKKELLESEAEWSQHKKLYETGGCVRGTVPSGFSYFDVSFGLRSGFAHVIEDENQWPADFGRDVLEGLIEHPESGIPLARRSKESFEKLKARVLDFSRAFKPYDWTQQL